MQVSSIFLLFSIIPVINPLSLRLQPQLLLLCFPVSMVPPNETANLITQSCVGANGLTTLFSISDGKLAVKGVPLLSELPQNITISSFSSICQVSSAPAYLFQEVLSRSHKGAFIGFSSSDHSDRLVTSLGRFSGRSFLSVFRFKTWWTTMWTGSSGSELQMETQWVLFDVPELSSYVFLLPLIEDKFRSALQPGSTDHVMLCAESGSTRVRASSFRAIAYLHCSDNPFTSVKEAFTAARVHLDTFRLLEEKMVPPIVDKFGWCTWDAFYLTLDPLGVWHGVNDFFEGGLPLRFLIIDDGWQSINYDGESPTEDSKNLVLGGEQMTGRLYRFEECERFRRYMKGSFLRPRAPPFNPNRTKMLIAKAIDLERAEKARNKAIESGVTDISSLESKIMVLRRRLNEMFDEEQDDDIGRKKQSNLSFCDRLGLKAFTEDLRTKFKELNDIYVWHALCGAWGGVRPDTTHLNSKVIPVKVSPGLEGTMYDLAVIKIVEAGIGLVHPDQAVDFYEAMHSYLSKSGITGVKVDVIHTLEYVSEQYGGRVELAKAYYKGLSESLVRNFRGTCLISSMQQCNDFFFLGTSQISMGRVGDDFWFQDPNGDPMGVYWLQGVHMIHCSYNSMWMSQMIQPDWDMFQSDHVCAKFHAGSRAICGGPVYLSDSVGSHDFELIRKLVYPDGTIPRCQNCALPTRDCLFKNPVSDGETILKIWNFNKFGGVVGAFNCQGAGWDQEAQCIRAYPHCYKPVSGSVHVRDVEWNQKKEGLEIRGIEEFAVYLAEAKELLPLSLKSDAIEITLQPLSFEIFSFVPIRKLDSDLKFAPIGLTNMLNSGGAIFEAEYYENEDGVNARIKVKGGGKLLVYSSKKPKRCFIDEIEVGFEWLVNGKLTVNLPWNEEKCGFADLVFCY